MVKGTNYTGSCKFNYHTITTTMAPISVYLIACVISRVQQGTSKGTWTPEQICSKHEIIINDIIMSSKKEKIEFQLFTKKFCYTA